MKSDNERRLSEYAQAARARAGIDAQPPCWDGFGHPGVIARFLPSQALLKRTARHGDLEGDDEICRASEALDARRRSAHDVQLKDGQCLSLHEIDPDTELDGCYRQVDQWILEAREREGPGIGAAKSYPGGIGSGRSSGRHGGSKGRHGKKKSNSKNKGPLNSDSDSEYDYGTSLLMSVRTAYYFLLVRRVVGGDATMMRIGPVSAKHTVADLAVLVCRQTGLEVSRQRMTFRGRLLALGDRLGPLGLVNEFVTDPVMLTEVSETTFYEMMEAGAGGRQMLERMTVGEKLTYC